MEYEYKGTVYEFPDDMDDNQALKLIRADQGEDTTSTEPPQKTQEQYQEKKLGIGFGGITGSYSVPSIDIGPSYRQRIDADIKRQAEKDIERQKQGGNKNLSEIAGKMQSMAAPIRQAPGANELGQVIGGVAGGVSSAVRPKQRAPEGNRGSGMTFGVFTPPIVDPAKVYAESPNIRSLGDIATASGEILPVVGTAGKFSDLASKSITDLPAASRGLGLDKTIKTGIDKGIKPTVKNKSNYSQMKQFDQKANQAVKTIAQNQDKIKLVDEFGEAISYPRNAAEMAQAIEKNKEYIFKQYDDMAKAAGQGGARFSTDNLQRKLDDIIRDVGNPDEVVNHAVRLKFELEKLHGASPETVQKRIAYYNKSLEGYYAGRQVSQAKAQVEGSVAKALRDELDDNIVNAVGPGYSELKKQYGALKAIEKEVNHRAVVNARKASKGVADITDIFTGGDLLAGAITGNPALITRGIAGRGIKEGIKKLNDPDRYVKKMFKDAYKQYESKK